MKARYIFIVGLLSTVLGHVEISRAFRVPNTPGSTSHYLTFEFFTSQSEAEQECHQFAESHGYDGMTVCRLITNYTLPEEYDLNLSGNLSAYEAGWLWQQANITVEPFELGYFIFGVECPEAMIPNPDTSECGCANNDFCNDGDMCNGSEQCLSDGTCASGEPLVCEDDRVCALPSCDPEQGCMVELSEALCECNTEPSPPLNSGLSLSLPTNPSSTPCAIFGGQKSVSVSLSADLEIEPPSCANECQSGTDASLSLSGNFELCGIQAQAQGVGSYQESKQGCIECDLDTCEERCGSGTCDTKQSSGQLGLTASRFFGGSTEVSRGEYEVSAKCGATLSLNTTLTVSQEKTQNNGYQCGRCSSCELNQLESSLNASASADCFINLKANGMSKSIGCIGCAAMELQGTTSVSQQTGECGEENCASAQVHSKLVVESPAVELSFAWWSVSARCRLSGSQCYGISTCGGATCDEAADALSLSCNVQ